MHRGRRRLVPWLESMWRCNCEYSNVATYRCYGCGHRPPRWLRRRLEADVQVVGHVDGTEMGGQVGSGDDPAAVVDDETLRTGAPEDVERRRRSL